MFLFLRRATSFIFTIFSLLSYDREQRKLGINIIKSCYLLIVLMRMRIKLRVKGNLPLAEKTTANALYHNPFD